MLLLVVGMMLAMLAVVTSWGSDIDAQARFRLETVRLLGTGARHTPAA